MQKSFPADAHDAGFVAVDWKKGFQLMLMILGSWWWSGQGGFPADAHDAVYVAVAWKKEKGFQLMLMMLGSWQWIGKRFSN